MKLDYGICRSHSYMIGIGCKDWVLIGSDFAVVIGYHSIARRSAPSITVSCVGIRWPSEVGSRAIPPRESAREDYDGETIIECHTGDCGFFRGVARVLLSGLDGQPTDIVEVPFWIGVSPSEVVNYLEQEVGCTALESRGSALALEIA
jgi:hypothetical protein